LYKYIQNVTVFIMKWCSFGEQKRLNKNI